MAKYIRERTCRIESSRWEDGREHGLGDVRVWVSELSCGHQVETLTDRVSYCDQCGARIERDK